jgi:hypothetical protein
MTHMVLIVMILWDYTVRTCFGIFSNFSPFPLAPLRELRDQSSRGWACLVSEPCYFLFPLLEYFSPDTHNHIIHHSNLPPFPTLFFL